jgi:hypothetical protein
MESPLEWMIKTFLNLLEMSALIVAWLVAYRVDFLVIQPANDTVIGPSFRATLRGSVLSYLHCSSGLIELRQWDARIPLH